MAINTILYTHYNYIQSVYMREHNTMLGLNFKNYVCNMISTMKRGKNPNNNSMYMDGENTTSSISGLVMSVVVVTLPYACYSMLKVFYSLRRQGLYQLITLPALHSARTRYLAVPVV